MKRVLFAMQIKTQDNLPTSLVLATLIRVKMSIGNVNYFPFTFSRNNPLGLNVTTFLASSITASPV